MFCLTLFCLWVPSDPTLAIQMPDPSGFNVLFQDDMWNQKASGVGFQMQATSEAPFSLWFGPAIQFPGKGKIILNGPKATWKITCRESKREPRQLGVLADHVAVLDLCFERDENGVIHIASADAESDISLEIKTFPDLKSLSSQYAQGRIDGWFGVSTWDSWLTHAKGEQQIWEKDEHWILVADDSLAEDLLRRVCRVAQDRLADLGPAKTPGRWAALLRSAKLSASENEKWATAVVLAWQQGPYEPFAIQAIAFDANPYRSALNWIPSQKEKVVVSRLAADDANQ
ncbi:MAG: hypothetical protein H6510_03605 [Acidobacteria bacterium]|nr:hypothetical protein [Acidobacteriota bacterium]MCB9396883.1 hypothetical protein [Acidobacteriota bacterium]